MAQDGENQPLKDLAEAFHQLSNTLNSPDSVLQVAPFAKASSLVLPLIRLLDIEYKFAERDFEAKVNRLADAANVNQNMTLNDMIEQDIQNNDVRTLHSCTRELVRVKRGLNMAKALFEGIIANNFGENCVRDAALQAQEAIFTPFLSAFVDMQAKSYMEALPKWSHFKTKLYENDNSAREAMNCYIHSVEVVINYIDDLFKSKNMETNW